MDSSWRRRPWLPWCKAGGLQTCVTFPGNATARRGTRPGPNPFTARLDTWKLSKNLLSQSCQHVYCMTILQEEFRCFVNFELFEHCVCVTEQCPTPPHPIPHTPPPNPLYRLPEPRVNTKPRSLAIYNIWLPNIPDALWNLWSNLFQEWVLWRLCLILLLIFVFLMLCFYAALH